MSNSSISRIYVPINTANGPAEAELADPLVGPSSTWASTNDFAVEVMGMMVRREDVIEGYAGSDETIMLANDTHSFQQVISWVIRVYESSTPAQRQDGAYLRARFREASGDANMEFVGRGEDAVFRVEYRYVNPMADRSTGVRQGGMSGNRLQPRRGDLRFQGASRGHVAELRIKFGEPENIGTALRILMDNPEWCWSYRDRDRRINRLSAGATLLRLQGMACVPLGYWLRLDKGPLSDFCYTLLGVAPRNQQEVGRRLPRKLSKANGELAFLICAVLAREAKIPAYVYWDSHMSDHVSIQAVNAISHEFGINSYVMRMDAFLRYNEQLNVNGKKLGFTQRSQWPAESRSDKTNVSVMIRCLGRASEDNTGKNRSRDGHDVMLICSRLDEEIAHVDFVLDPVYENNMFGKSAGNVLHFNMTYGKPGEDTRPYYDRLVLDKEASKVTPKHSYMNLDGIDIVEIIRTTGSHELVRIDTDMQYETETDSVIDGLVRLTEGRYVDTKVFDRTFICDNEFVQDKSDELGRVKRNTTGLIHLMGDVMRRLKDKQKDHLVDCSNFQSSTSPQRIQRLYGYQLRTPEGEKGVFDVPSNFNDVSRFSLSLCTPRTTSGQDRVQGRKRARDQDNNEGETDAEEAVDKLMTVYTYSKKKFEQAGMYLETEYVKKAFDDACETVKRLHCGTEKEEKRFDKLVREGKVATRFKLALASTSMFRLVLGRDTPNVFGKITDMFGDTHAYLERAIRTTDPNIDEPVICGDVIRFKRDSEDDAIEMDANSFYPSIMAGRHHGVLAKDFYGLQWLDKIGDHSVRTKLKKDDFLRSYDSDLGSCFVEDIDFAVLELQLGLTRLCSWSHFDAARVDKVSRTVLNASVIHFTSVLYEKIKKKHDAYSEQGPLHRPWLYDLQGNPGAIWRFIQHDVLHIKWVFFHNDEDVRIAGHRLQEMRRTAPLTVLPTWERRGYDKSGTEPHKSMYNEFELGKGILMRGDVMKKKKSLSKVFDESHRHTVEILTKGKLAKLNAERRAKGEELTEKDRSDATAYALKVAKLDENSFIGKLKYLQYSGGLKTIRYSDAIETVPAEEENEPASWTFKGIVMKAGYATQMSTCNLPDTDLVLKENVLVSPMATSKGPAGLRRNTLEIARLVMDMMVDVSDAYQSKTDAVFFHPSNLPAVIDFLHKSYINMVPLNHLWIRQSAMLSRMNRSKELTADEVMAQLRQCQEEGCNSRLPKPKHCKKHCPVDIDRQTLARIAPFKFILHPGTGPEQLNGAQMFGKEAQQQRIQETEHTRLGRVDGLTQLSRAGGQLIQEAIDALDTPRETKLASSCLPSIQEMLVNGMLAEPDAHQIIDDPPKTLSKLELHCKIFNTDEGYDACVYVPGCAQPRKMDKEKYNAFYVDKMLELMVDWKDGAKIEGKPGMGKSYMIHKLVKEHFYPDVNTVTIVATSTQLSIAPYRELTAWEDERREEEFAGQAMVPPPRIHALTVHSLFNIFNQTKELSRNPPEYIFKQDGRMRGIKKILSEHNSALNAGKSARLQIIVDEFEMCQREFEEPLLCMAEMRGVYIHCVGDRMQTAAIGTGIRCDGDVVNTITKNRTLVFDVPFRNTDYEYQLAHERACNGEPTLFLRAPLADYTHAVCLESYDVLDLTRQTAAYYKECAEKKMVYSRRVIAVQHYKVAGALTTMVLDHMPDEFYNGGEVNVFCGHRSFARNDKESEDAAGIYGDDDTDVVQEEDPGAVKRYEKALNHNTTNPGSVGFYVGTQMAYRLNYSYRATRGFTPKLRQLSEHANLREKEPQRPVRMGEVLMLTRLEEKNVSVVQDNGRKKKEKHVFGQFVTEKGEVFVLQSCEMRAYLYYPFCLLTMGVVGNTYDNYTFVHLSRRSSRYHAYHELWPVLNAVEKHIGNKAHTLSVVKMLNVGVSRVTKGNRTQILEVGCYGAAFWQKVLRNTKWHIYQTSRFDARLMRHVAMRAGHKLKLEDPISSIFG